MNTTSEQSEKELNKTQILKYKAQIKDLEKQISDLSDKLSNLVKNCEHKFKVLTKKQLADRWMSEGAYCSICERNFGWRCKVSPDQCCHYYTIDGKVKLINGTLVQPPENHDFENENDDSCIFCEMPEERK